MTTVCPPTATQRLMKSLDGSSGHWNTITSPRRGEVIVFQWPEDPSKDFIKRCVAVGGQTVVMKHKELYVDGVKAVEPYVKHDNWSEEPAGYTPRDNYAPPTVPP